ncbi:MAG: hypothetical protein IM664_05575 [Phenylobacterium sp.]|uniref:hypothetical protein n=1 Tax=Phenylobacterium sp. TaxID=1871053 RepID=UPI0025CE43FE|nr:hypothetical protein [Phenylobacterium sp.]MCA6334070.1 hypothetical protein [Phenylobacterium sp.]
MKGLIVLEGPDAAGKTTLGKKIAEMTGGTYLHATYRFRARMFTYQTALLYKAIRLSDHQVVVIDRLWPSETIYADVFRGGSRWPLGGRYLDRLLQKHAALHVLCLPPDVETAVRRHRANLDDNHAYDDERFAEVVRRYLDFGYGAQDDRRTMYEKYDSLTDYYALNGGILSRGDWVNYCIDTYGHDMEGYVQFLLDELAGLRAEQPDWLLDPHHFNWLGYHGDTTYNGQPKILFLGEKVNQKSRVVAWPFYDYGNSSLFLTKVIHDLRLDERQCCFMNAYDHFDREAFMKGAGIDCYSFTIVPLGRIAANFMDLRLRPGPSAYHPQFAKRFGLREDFMAQIRHVIADKEKVSA